MLSNINFFVNGRDRTHDFNLSFLFHPKSVLCHLITLSMSFICLLQKTLQTSNTLCICGVVL